MSHRWYYQLLGQEFGPVTMEQIQQLAEDGTLSNDDQVRPEDSTQWIAAASLVEFPPTGDSGPAEIADLSELSFSFEPTGPTQRRTAYSKSEPPRVSPANKSGPPKEPSFKPQEAKAEIYYCQSLGQTLGPMSVTELAGMAETGSLSDSDLVRLGPKGVWQPASSISELSATLVLGDRGPTDAAPMSATTQKRLGPAAVANLNAALIAENVSVTLPQEAANSETPQPAASPDATVLADRKKVRKRKGKKGEEELIDEIFDDVFANDEDEKSSHRSTPSQPLTATSTAPAVASETSAQPKPVPAVSAYSSTSPSPATAARAAMAAAAASHASSRPRRSLDLSFEGPVKFVSIAVLLIAVIGGLIWQFGMPSLSFGHSNLPMYSGRMAVAISRYKALGEKPSVGQWEDFCHTTKSEFLASFKVMRESGASSAKDTACMEGMQALIALAETDVEDEDRQKELAAQVNKSLAAMK